MEIKSLQDFFIGHSIEIFDTLFNIRSQELEKNIETKEMIREIDISSFYYTKSVNCVYGDINGNLKISCSKEFVEILIQHSEEDIKKYYDQMDVNILLSNYIGILIYTPYKKLRLIYNYNLDFDLPADIPVMDIFKQKRILLFSKNNVPLVYLGVTFDN